MYNDTKLERKVERLQKENRRLKKKIEQKDQDQKIVYKCIQCKTEIHIPSSIIHQIKYIESDETEISFDCPLCDEIVFYDSERKKTDA